MNGNGNWEKAELYVVSLWFLFLLLIVVTIDIPIYQKADWQFVGFKELARKNIIPIVALIFLLLGWFFCKRFEYRISGSQLLPVKITKIEDVNYEHLTFLTTYIIPLICFNLSSVQYVLALAILLIVIGVIYIQTDKFYANPTLALLGYKVYKTSFQGRHGQSQDMVLITRTKLAIEDRVQLRYLDEKVSFARKI